jgi:predicted SnoaL-like aldol condensation-catalyzing enzyme
MRGLCSYVRQVAGVMVGPEYTTIQIRALTEGQASWNVFDMYRTLCSCIIEHWDCLQDIQNKTVSTHPYFMQCESGT